MQFWIDFDKENASTHDMLSQSHRRAAVRIFKITITISVANLKMFDLFTDGSTLVRFSLLWALGA